MPSQRVIPPHPTDTNSRHDDRYPLESRVSVSIKPDGTLEESAVDTAAQSLGIPTGPEWSANEATTQRLDLQRFDVEAYGANPDGSGDNRLAIQAAIDAAEAAGGGVIWFPRPLLYGVTSVAGSSYGIAWSLEASGDNIIFDGVPGSGINHTADSGVFFLGGAARPAGAANWIDSCLQEYTKAPLYGMAPASKGEMAITLTTPADAANFAPGDDIYIRTGQLVEGDFAPYAFQPDAELNVVVDANPSTGVILLRYPLAKPYAQEYFFDGHPLEGDPCPFGVVNATDRVSRNIGIHTIKVTHTSLNHCLLQGGQIVGLSFRGCTFETNVALTNMNVYRDFTFDRTSTFFTRDSATEYGWWLASATGCSDGIISHNVMGGAMAGQLHIHEGSARIKIFGNTMSSRRQESGFPVHTVSVRSRAYDVDIYDNDITHFHDTNGSPIFVDETCVGGGRIGPNRIVSDKHINVGSPNWTVEEQIGARTSYYNHANGGRIPSNGFHATPQVVSNWVSGNQLSATLGPLPEFVVMTRVMVWLEEAFNEPDTFIGVGIPGYETAYGIADGTDMTPGHRWYVLESNDLGYHSYQTGPFSLTATVGYVGPAPTTGKALVAVEYIPVARMPA